MSPRPAVFAERMGLPLASGRMPNGHWLDFDTLAEELRQFVEQQQEREGELGRPAAQQAKDAAAGSSGSTSTSSASTSTSTSSSSGGGGGSSTSSSTSSPQPGTFLPTQQELRAGGRADLIGGIRLHGGSLAVANRLGWGVRRGKLPSEAAVVQQLLEFVTARQQEQQEQQAAGSGSDEAEQPAGPLAMPTLRQLQEGGRADLATAVLKLGGVSVFAHLLEAEQQRRQQQNDSQSAAAQQAHPATQQQEQPQQQEEEGVEGQEDPAEQAPQRRFVLHEGRQHEGAAHILSYPPGSISGSGSNGGDGSSAGIGPGEDSSLAGSLAHSSGSRRWARLAQPPQPAVVRVGQALMQLIEARGWERRVPTKQVGEGQFLLVGAGGLMCCGVIVAVAWLSQHSSPLLHIHLPVPLN